MSMPQFLESLAEKLQSSATVKTIYGDAIVAEGKTIIPVARVAYGLGGGYGKVKTYDDQGRKQEKPAGQSGGGGIRVTPLGVIEVTQQHTKYIPLQHGKVTWIGFVLVGLLMGVFLGKR